MVTDIADLIDAGRDAGVHSHTRCEELSALVLKWELPLKHTLIRSAFITYQYMSQMGHIFGSY